MKQLWHWGVAGLLGAVLALVQPARAFPDFSACGPFPADAFNLSKDPGQPAAARLAAVVTLGEYGLCTTKIQAADPERVRPTGDAEFWAALIALRERSLEMVKARTSFPAGNQVQERAERPDRMAAAMDAVIYFNLGTDLWHEDHCPFPRPGSYCVENTTLTMVEGQGKDGRSELARLAATRLVPPDPWFLIGAVKVDVDPANNDQLALLQADRMLAVDALQRALKTEDDFKTRLDVVEAAAHAAATARGEALAEQGAELFALRQEFLPDGPAPADQPEADRIGARLDQIDLALKALRRDYPATDSFAQGRIADLMSERAPLADRRAALAGPQPSDEDLATLKQAQDDLALDVAEHGRRIQNEERRIERAEALLAEARVAREAAEAALARIDADLADWHATRIAALAKLTTTEAEIAFVPETRAQEIADLDQAIADLGAEQTRLAERREAVRADMLEKSRLVEAAADELLSQGNYSLAAQVGTEMIFVVADLAKAGQKAGVHGVGVEALRQLTNKAMFPPSYTDAERASFTNYVATYSDKWELGEKTLKVGAKKLVGTPFKSAIQKIAAATSGPVDTSAVRAMLANAGGTNGILRDMKALNYQLRKLDDALEKRLGKLDSPGAKGLARDLGKGLLKNATKEAIKGFLAEAIEGGALDRYVLAQMTMSDAVLVFRHLGTRYWALEDQIADLRRLRAALAQDFDAEVGLVIRKNRAFFADPGYAITLHPAEDVVVEDLRIEMRLGDVLLTRSGTSLVWTVPDGAEFGLDLPEKLPLRITFK